MTTETKKQFEGIFTEDVVKLYDDYNAIKPQLKRHKFAQNLKVLETLFSTLEQFLELNYVHTNLFHHLREAIDMELDYSKTRVEVAEHISGEDIL